MSLQSVLFILGFLCIVIGCSLAWLPLGPISAGVIICGLILLDIKGARK